MENFSDKIDKMLKPYREIAKIAQPMAKIQKQFQAQNSIIQKTLKPTLDLQNKIFNSHLLEIQKSFEKISKIYIDIPKFENPFLEHLKTFQEIGERLKAYSEETPKCFLLIAQHGWYIDLESELNFPALVAEKLNSQQENIAYELLADYYRQNIQEIFERLIKRHPNRKEVFLQSLEGFNSNLHFLVIPTLLSQIDGICFDFTKKKFFLKERNNKYLPQITSELENSASSFLSLYLSPLQNQTPIMVREEDIDKFPCKLNRHEILHGINSEYGTEINSLKIISLIKYISDLLTDLDNKHYA